VKKAKFHIWPVKTIDQGIEILTNVKAGRRQRNGQFPKETVNNLVDEKLRQMAMTLKKFGAEEEKSRE
jgi:predicted ATP-dependent protease